MLSYALRVASILEYQNLVVHEETSSWENEYANMDSGSYSGVNGYNDFSTDNSSVSVGRRGGNML